MSDTAKPSEAATLRFELHRAIFDPGDEVGMRHNRSVSEWQTDAVLNVLDRLLPRHSPEAGEERLLAWCDACDIAEDETEVGEECPNCGQPLTRAALRKGSEQ